MPGSGTGEGGVMLLRPFGNAEPDTTAACQQAALVWCLYQNDRVRAEQLLGAGGAILAWVHRPDSWPPSYAVIRTTDQRHFVVYTGTTNLAQVQGHVLGTFWRSAADDVSRVNGQWQQVIDEVAEEIRPLLPADLTDTTTYVSGHSYGGAVAHLLACRLVGESAPARVQCLTFGEPKALTVGYTGPTPTVHWRLASTNDIVQNVPPDESLWGADPWALPPAWRLLPIEWTHYGRGRTLHWNGAYTPPIALPPDPPPPGVGFGPTVEHLGRNYWGRLRQRTLNVESTPDAVAALAIMDATLNGPPAQAMTPRLPAAVRVRPSESLAEIPEPPAPPVPPTTEVPPMAAPAVPLTPQQIGKIMHVTQFFQAGDSGWSENWHVNVTEVGNAYGPAEQWAQAMNLVRRSILAKANLLKATRVSDIDGLKDASLVKAPKLQAGKGERPAPLADHELGWVFTANDSTNQVNAPRFLRGFNLEDRPYSVDDRRTPDTQPPAITAYVQAVRQLITADWTQDGSPAKVRALIKSYDRTQPMFNVAKFEVNASGYITFTLPQTTNTAPFALRDKVHLSHKRTKCVRGVSGEAMITGVNPENPAGPYTTDSRACCGADKLVNIVGQAQKRVLAWYQIDEFNPGFMSDRDTGAPFGLSRGRRSGRCC